MNKVILIGNVGQDAESRNTTSGKRVTNFSLATNEGKDRTEWHRIVCFEKTAELCADLVKGAKLAIEGRIQTRSWEKDGQKRFATEIVADRVEFLSPKQARTEQPAQGVDEDIPF